MNKIRLIAVCTLLFPLLTIAQGWPSSVNIVASSSNQTVSVAGDLSSGAILDNLRWASNSSNACFVATENVKFEGNHVFYATRIPPHAVMSISVNPVANKTDLSLYAYMSAIRDFHLVPDLPGCVTCEADFKWDRPKKGRVQTAERMIQFSNPTDHDYNILIGVTAPRGVTSGAFNLSIRLKT